MRPIMFAALLVPAPALAQVTPGQWTTTITVNSMEMPGMPAGVAAMMRGHPMTVKQCITPEQAAKGPQEMLKSDKSCKVAHYSVAGGKFSSEVICTRGGQTTTATSSGSYTATSFNATGRTVGMGAQPMTMTSTVTGTRTGDCR